MLTQEMRELIMNNTVGCVATVTPDGRPAVSPKATFIVIDEKTLAFSDIRSPGTVRNIAGKPSVEVNFVDVFRRKACRISGRASYALIGDVKEAVLASFTEKWPDLVRLMKGIVTIDIADAAILTSPSYDAGAEEADLIEHWLQTYANLFGRHIAQT